MLSQCKGCFLGIARFFCPKNQPKWLSYLQQYCLGEGRGLGWCQLFLDNLNIIRRYPQASSQTKNHIKQTNIGSEITKIILEDYNNNEESPFRFSLDLFASYSKLKYSDIINPSNNTLKKLHTDFTRFIQLIKDTLVLYYDLEQRQIHGQQNFYKTSLGNIIIDLLYDNQEFKEILQIIVKGVFGDTNDRVNFNIKKYSYSCIQDCGVKIEFALNQNTLRNYQVRSIVDVEDQVPYSGSIQILKQITKNRNPCVKLLLLDELFKQIQSSIKHFYQKYDLQPKKLQLTAKTLTPILHYLIIQAYPTNLVLHIKTIQYFSNEKAKNSKQQLILECLNKNIDILDKGSRKMSDSSIDENTQHSMREINKNIDLFLENNNFDQVTSL